MSADVVPLAVLTPVINPAIVAVFACARPGLTRAGTSSAPDHASVSSDGCAASGVVSASAAVLVVPVTIFAPSPIYFALRIDSFLARIFTMRASHALYAISYFFYCPPDSTLF